MIYSFDAIGSRWWIERLDGKEWTHSQKKAVDRHVAEFDSRYSRFREDSYVAKLYREKQVAHVPEEFIRMLHFSKDAYVATSGIFDCTVGSRLHELGYGKRHVAPNFNHDDFWQEIVITKAQVGIPEHVMLDFGGFGKGWLIDTLRNVLLLAGIQYFIINGGGDIYVQAPNPVKLALEGPDESHRSFGTVTIASGAVAVSGTHLRTWSHNGEMYHHVIDPRTSLPAKSSVGSSVVIAESATVADMVATSILIEPSLTDKLEHEYAAKIIAIK